MNGWRILVVEDGKVSLSCCGGRACARQDFLVRLSIARGEVVARLEAKPYDLVILDIRLLDLPGARSYARFGSEIPRTCL